MSRRVAQTITISLRLPVPAGYKPPAVVKQIKDWLQKEPVFKGYENQIQVRLAAREVTYL